MGLGDQRQGPAVLSWEITPLRGTGSWLDTTAGLDVYGENIYFHPTGFSPGLSSLSELLYRLYYSVTCTET
jgi:hypothetical protein